MLRGFSGATALNVSRGTDLNVPLRGGTHLEGKRARLPAASCLSGLQTSPRAISWGGSAEMDPLLLTPEQWAAHLTASILRGQQNGAGLGL